MTNILFNILDNSLKYNNKKPYVKITLSKNSSKIDLKIIDNGIGIDNSYLDKVFERFFRVPTGNVHDVKGFGLGLFYVKKVVDQHGWRIKVQSVPGEGTTVNLVI